MARATELNLIQGFELARIYREALPFGVFIGSGVAALALHSRDGGLEVAVDCRGVAANAGLQGFRRLAGSQGSSCVGRQAGVLTDRYAVLVKLGEVTDARFKDAARGLHQWRLALGAGAQHPLNDSCGGVGTPLCGYRNAVSPVLIQELVAVSGLLEDPIR